VFGLHFQARLLPQSWAPSPQLDEGRPERVLRLVGGGGGRGVGARVLVSRAAAPLFVLDERQDVGEGEGPAALAAGQEVTTLARSLDLWCRRRPVAGASGAIRHLSDICQT